MELNVTHAGRIAQAAIKYVGDFLLTKQNSVKADFRNGAKGLMSDLDKEVGTMVQKFLGAEFPDHGFTSEEVHHNTEAEYVWVVDPIDGTRHYVRGLPFYSVSLALQYKGDTILGVVYAPTTKELFLAVKGEGAYCNDHSIGVSTIGNVEEALLCVEFPTIHQKDFEGSIKVLQGLAHHAMRVRALGYSSLGLCYVAKGCFDGYIDFSNTTKKVDYVAAQLILEEAGGTMELLGGDPVEVFASNRALHEKVKLLIGEE